MVRQWYFDIHLQSFLHDCVWTHYFKLTHCVKFYEVYSDYVVNLFHIIALQTMKIVSTDCVVCAIVGLSDTTYYKLLLSDVYIDVKFSATVHKTAISLLSSDCTQQNLPLLCCVICKQNEI